MPKPPACSAVPKPRSLGASSRPASNSNNGWKRTHETQSVNAHSLLCRLFVSSRHALGLGETSVALDHDPLRDPPMRRCSPWPRRRFRLWRACNCSNAASWISFCRNNTCRPGAWRIPKRSCRSASSCAPMSSPTSSRPRQNGVGQPDRV